MQLNKFGAGKGSSVTTKRGLTIEISSTVDHAFLLKILTVPKS